MALGVALAGAACGGPVEVPSAEALGVVETDVAVPMCAVPESGPRSLTVDTLATGLSVPWDVAFLPDGRALVTERSGTIRAVAADGTLESRPWLVMNVYAQEEVGLMGIDVHETEDGLHVYVSATHRRNPSNIVDRIASGLWSRLLRATGPERGHRTTLRVYRIPVEAGQAGEPEVVVSGLPAFMLHGGGALRVGPDGFLHVTNGDGTEPWTAHDPDSRRGKILRYALDGTPAGAESGSPVLARGVRHVQGLAWHPESGDLFAIDHGPSGMEQEGYRGNRDELNLVRPGDHLGWPMVTGTTSGEGLTSALVSWTPAIAPAGLAIYDGPVEAWSGDAFVTGLRGETLRRLELERDGDATWRVVCEEVVFQQEFGRLRFVRVAPDGTLWMSTSNGDGRGVPREDGDWILRVGPPVESSPER